MRTPLARLSVLAVTLVLVIGSALVTGAPAGAATPSRTLISNVNPTSTTNFTIKPGYRITKTYHRGACTDSETVAGAARCFTTYDTPKSYVFDPCWAFDFAGGHPGGVVCLPNAWSTSLTRIALASNMQKRVRGTSLWGVTLLNGAHCTRATGAVNRFHGYPIRYECTDGRALIRDFDRSRPLWRVTFVATFGYDRQQHAGTATVTRAWYGHGHRGG